ncbi:MAG: hypothetical protein GSR85_04145 [Desulfurococcales archaeon]|nr:hypothetical protein [Desulfurococcales archaeon]
MVRRKKKHGRRYILLLTTALTLGILTGAYIYVNMKPEWIPVINMTRVVNNTDIDYNIDRKIEYKLEINIIDVKSIREDLEISVGTASDCNNYLNMSEYTFKVDPNEMQGFSIKLKPGYKLCYIVLEDGVNIYPYSSFSVEGPGRVILTFNYPTLRAFVKMDFVIEKLYITVRGKQGDSNDDSIKLLVEWLNANVTSTSIEYECRIPCNLALDPPIFATSVNVYIHR